jgi:B12-binding domain/radical SAM domain protein
METRVTVPVLKTVSNTKPAGSLALILYYHWLNRFSFNALAGAIDSNPELACLPVTLATTADRLQRAAAALLRRYDRVAVALSILTSQMKTMRHLARQLRSDFGARVAILAGGAHPTACADEVLRDGADVVFRGEAEVSFPSVLKRMAENADYRDIPGLACLSDDSGILRPHAQPVDLDRFFSFSPKRGMFGPIEITRGCPFACGYCQTSHIFGTQPRHRGIDSIVRQAEALRSGHRKVVRLLSPNAFSYGSPDGRQINLPAMRELLAALRETVSAEGRIIFAHFPSEARPEHVTPETLELLKEFADNDEIVIGAQSGSQRVLDACRRSHTVEDILKAASLARKHGIKVIVDFIFGLPGESPSDEQESLSVIRKLALMGARIHPHAFAPLPQTAFSAEPPARISSAVARTIEELKAQQGIYVNRREILRGFESLG